MLIQLLILVVLPEENSVKRSEVDVDKSTKFILRFSEYLNVFYSIQYVHVKSHFHHGVVY